MSFDCKPLGSLLRPKGYVRGPFGSALRRPELKSQGIPVYEQQQAIDGHRKFRYFIDTEKYAELKRFTVQPNDLIVSCSGTVGRISIIADSDPAGIISQALLILRPDIAVLTPVYLYYFLISQQGQAELIKASHGAVQQNIAPREVVERIPTPLPSLSEQHRIVGVLSALDSRIILLRETNATLEAIAQALFKSWFVDFDPVRAKMEGRVLEGMDEATAALFPDSFEETELGAVPRGWKFSKLSDVCSYLNRGVSPKYVDDGGVLVLNQKCIRDFSVDYAKGRRHDPLQRKVDGRYLALGDVLVNSTGVGTLGRVAQVLDLPEPAIVDSHVTVVRSGEKLSWPYLGQWMTRKQPEIEAMGEGSTGQTELSRAKLGDLMVLVPTSSLLAVFDSLVEPLKQRMSLNERKSQTVAALRDTLLPRLISGQLRLPEAQTLTDAEV